MYAKKCHVVFLDRLGSVENLAVFDNTEAESASDEFTQRLQAAGIEPTADMYVKCRCRVGDGCLRILFDVEIIF